MTYPPFHVAWRHGINVCIGLRFSFAKGFYSSEPPTAKLADRRPIMTRASTSSRVIVRTWRRGGTIRITSVLGGSNAATNEENNIGGP